MVSIFIGASSGLWSAETCTGDTTQVASASGNTCPASGGRLPKR
ncbi:MAG: hypothetical protein WCW61_03355 [Patescibacteria group bacterium]